MASTVEDLIGLGVGLARPLRDPVHEPRKLHGELVRVVVAEEERTLVDRVVADDPACIAELVDRSAEVQRADLRVQAVALAAKVHEEPLKAQAKHRAGALGAAADHLLRFVVRLTGLCRKVSVRRNRRPIRPNHIVVHPKAKAAAGDAARQVELVVIKRLHKLSRVEVGIRPIGVSAIRGNRFKDPIDYGVVEVQGIFPAVRANKGAM